MDNQPELALCPCGERPKDLNLCYNGQGYKWASAAGDCCGEWMIEFKTGYIDLDHPSCMILAVEQWNEAPRAK